MERHIRLKIDKYLKYLTFIKSCSHLTIQSYKVDLEQYFFSKSSSKTLIEASKTSLQKRVSPTKFTRYLKDHLLSTRWISPQWSISTKNRKLSAVKSFLKWLYKEGLIKEDLNRKLRTPKIPSKVPLFLSLDEMLVLMNTLKQTKKEQVQKRDLTLILLLYGGGLRVSEACFAEWKNLNFKEQTLKIKGKGSKERIVALPDRVVEHLTKVKPLDKNLKYILGNPPTQQRVAYSIVKKWGQRAGLKKNISPHVLRHTYATHLLSGGSNLRVLQKLLGHKSLSATQKYTQIQLSKLNQTLSSFHPLNKKLR